MVRRERSLLKMMRDPVVVSPPRELVGDDWQKYLWGVGRRQPRWSRERGLRHPEKGVCGWCGKSLAGTLGRRWCSNECMLAAYRAMGTHLREDALAADRKAHRGKLVCAACGLRERREKEAFPLGYRWVRTDESEFDVDHVTPISLGGDPVDPANLQVLCHPCHTIKTARDRALVAAARRRLKFEQAMRGQRRLQVET